MSMRRLLFKVQVPLYLVVVVGFPYLGGEHGQEFSGEGCQPGQHADDVHGGV